MGWMHDTLDYKSNEPVHRKHHHDNLTFDLVYAFHENFILAISHDEVVHGKGFLINRMRGDAWQKFGNLRAYFGYMYGHPVRNWSSRDASLASGRNGMRKVVWTGT